MHLPLSRFGSLKSRWSYFQIRTRTLSYLAFPKGLYHRIASRGPDGDQCVATGISHRRTVKGKYRSGAFLSDEAVD